jgi:hypothetical protein
VTRSTARTLIESWSRFLETVRRETERINADPRLALAAASNPLLALEELGYDISPEARDEIESRLRFPAPALARRSELVAAIGRAAGREFRLDDPAEVERVLAELVGTRASKTRSRGRTTPSSGARPADAAGDRDTASADPLEAMRDAHPVVPPLIEYRRLEQRARRLAPRELYERIRRGELRTGVTRVRLRLPER